MDTKACSRCKSTKDELKDFYICQGKFRSECKVCTIKKNASYQRKAKPWKNRIVDEEEKRSYMTQYYRKNKPKFAEYRRKFRERYPDYYKEYFRKKKNPQCN